ncbi:MAG: hypothetical protein QM809_03870 [Gordonia sp. (in: high G+C Gram-positive bacteria)]
MTTRSSATRAAGVTRRTEAWPVYNVRGRCIGIALSIVVLLVAIVLLFVL